MTNTALLEQYIVKSGLKKSHIAKQLSISPYAFSLKLQGKNEFKASEIETLCKLLTISVAGRMNIFFAQTVDCKST